MYGRVSGSWNFAALRLAPTPELEKSNVRIRRHSGAIRIHPEKGRPSVRIARKTGLGQSFAVELGKSYVFGRWRKARPL